MTDTKIYCALDTDSLDHALHMAGMMEQAGCGLKLGMEFFNAQGPQGIAKIRATEAVKEAANSLIDLISIKTLVSSSSESKRVDGTFFSQILVNLY